MALLVCRLGRGANCSAVCAGGENALGSRVAETRHPAMGTSVLVGRWTWRYSVRPVRTRLDFVKCIITSINTIQRKRAQAGPFAVSLYAPTALKLEEHEGHEGHEGRHAPLASPTAAFGRRSERPPRSKPQAPYFRLGVCGFDLEGCSAAERGRRDVRRAPASVFALFFVSFVNFVSFVCGCRDCGGGWISGAAESFARLR